MHDFYPIASEKSYLRADLPVDFRLFGKHQGRICVWSAHQVHGDVEDWFLAPHASVVAAKHLQFPKTTTVIDLEVGQFIRIAGVTYEVRDDKRLDNPYFHRIVTTVTR